MVSYFCAVFQIGFLDSAFLFGFLSKLYDFLATNRELFRLKGLNKKFSHQQISVCGDTKLVYSLTIIGSKTSNTETAKIAIYDYFLLLLCVLLALFKLGNLKLK